MFDLCYSLFVSRASVFCGATTASGGHARLKHDILSHGERQRPPQTEVVQRRKGDIVWTGL